MYSYLENKTISFGIVNCKLIFFSKVLGAEFPSPTDMELAAPSFDTIISLGACLE